MVRSIASDATLGYVDEANVSYYDAAWRLLEERVDEGRFAPGTQPSEDDPFDGLTFAADRIIQRVWGLEYIDELLFVMEDDDEDMTDGTPTGRHAVVDRLYSVVGLLDEQAQLLERVRYSAYGVARQQWAFVGDVTGDGVVNVDDGNIIGPAIGSTLSDPAYVADADIDGDGDVDLTDVGFINGLAAPVPAGQVSNYGNTVGYAGYLFDPATGMCLARFRWYEPEIGRWATRDPTGYSDSVNLQEYVDSRPLRLVDSFGLVGVPAGPDGGWPLRDPYAQASDPAVTAPNPAQTAPSSPQEILEDIDWGFGDDSRGNCYRFACNRPTERRQPGESREDFLDRHHLRPGNDRGAPTCKSLKRGAIRDGLTEPDKCGNCPPGKTKVAYATTPPKSGHKDMHWWRQAPDGTWRHKRGVLPVETRDEDNEIIKDPKDANRGKYTEFCGYLCV